MQLTITVVCFSCDKDLGGGEGAFCGPFPLLSGEWTGRSTSFL